MGASVGAVQVDRPAPGDEPSDVCAQCESTEAPNDSESKCTDVEANACPICLEPISALDRTVLSCRHAFCFGCIDQYCSNRCRGSGDDDSQRTIDRSHPCPCCRRTVLIPECPDARRRFLKKLKRRALARSTGDDRESANIDGELSSESRQHRADVESNTRPGETVREAAIRQGLSRRADVESDRRPGETVREAAIRQGLSRQREAHQARLARAGSATRTLTPQLPPATVVQRMDALHELRQAAGRNVPIRFCPTCQAPSIKNGGCNNMICACGQRFKWSAARPLFPCANCHCEGSCLGRLLSAKACQYCSKKARAEAHARRAVGTVLAVPAAAAGAAVVVAGVTAGVAVALVPAAVFAGPAALYEPIRRYRKKKHNYLAYAAVSGAAVAVMCSPCAGYESD